MKTKAQGGTRFILRFHLELENPSNPKRSWLTWLLLFVGVGIRVFGLFS